MEDAVRLIELLQQAAEWNDEEASIYAASLGHVMQKRS
jgi:hypothetical protein